MASFDITTGCDMQEVDNALNQARKELTNRFDFKGSKWEIELNRKDSKILIHAEDQTKLKAVVELTRERLVKRGIPLQNVKSGPIVTGLSMGSVRQELTLAQGIAGDKAKEIVAFLKTAKLKKVQASIQGDLVRVTAPKRDELQEAIALLKGKDFELSLNFGNYRD